MATGPGFSPGLVSKLLGQTWPQPVSSFVVWGSPSPQGHLHPSPALGMLASGLQQGFPADLALWAFERVRSCRTLCPALENHWLEGQGSGVRLCSPRSSCTSAPSPTEVGRLCLGLKMRASLLPAPLLPCTLCHLHAWLAGAFVNVPGE